MSELERYIPKFLLPFKNDWLTQIEMDKLFYVTDGSNQYTIQSRIAKYQVPFRTQIISTGKHKFRKLYHLKRVLAILKANGVSPAQRNAEEDSAVHYGDVQITRVISPDFKRLEAAECRAKIAEEKLKELESELSSLRELESITKKLLDATPIKDMPGVYFLCQGDEIVYIGMSKTSCLERTVGRANLCSHSYMIETTPDSAHLLEARLIRIFQPRGNTHGIKKVAA